MISVPPGWTIEHLHEAIALTHPAGARAAQVHYRERAGRPRRIGSLAREILAAWSRIRVTAFGPIERLVTAEGELAAVVSVACEEAGRTLHIDLGFVFTDDFFTSIAGTCRDDALRGEIAFIVRDLVRQDNLALGVRRRRFEYQPPTGWQPLRHSLATEWLPPDYPSHMTTLFVYPANPIAVAGRSTFGSVHAYLEGHGWHVLEITAIDRGTTKHGLAFEAQDAVFQRPSQPPRRTRMVVPCDAVYQYPLELRMSSATDLEGDRAILAEVVDSVVPFGSGVNVPAVTHHWID